MVVSVWIKLEQQHIDYADDKVAKPRREAAKRLHRTPRNGASGEDVAAMAQDLLGARCECAGYLWLKPITGGRPGGHPEGKWHTFRDDPTKFVPDLGTFIDIKGRPKRDQDLPLNLDSVADTSIP